MFKKIIAKLVGRMVQRESFGKRNFDTRENLEHDLAKEREKMQHERVKEEEEKKWEEVKLENPEQA